MVRSNPAYSINTDVRSGVVANPVTRERAIDPPVSWIFEVTVCQPECAKPWIRGPPLLQKSSLPAPRNSTPAALISDCADAAELQKPIAKSSTYLILAHSGIGVAAPAKAIKMTTESKTIQTAYVEIWSDTDLDMLEANNARFPHALFDQDENVRNGKAKTVWYDNEAWNSNGLGDLDERAAHWSSTFAAMTWAKDGKLEQRTSWQDVFNNHSANMLGIMEFIKDGEKLVSLRVHEIPGSGVSLQAQGK